MELLFKEGHYPEIATHDEAVIREAVNIAEKLNMKKEEYEVQMLMGVPKQAFQDELIASGILVRLYVPFAEKWKYASAYSKRRLYANPAMAAKAELAREIVMSFSMMTVAAPVFSNMLR